VLFKGIDLDQDGLVTKAEIAGCHGGDAEGLFDGLSDEHSDGMINAKEWRRFWGQLKQECGSRYITHVLQFLATSVTVQKQMKEAMSHLPSVSHLVAEPSVFEVQRHVVQPKPRTVESPATAAASACDTLQGELTNLEKAELVKAFELLDSTHDGQLAPQDLSGLFDISTDRLSEMMGHGDDSVNFEDFVRFFSNVKYMYGPITVSLITTYLVKVSEKRSNGEGIIILPIGALLLPNHSEEQPEGCEETDARLSGLEDNRIVRLFKMVDVAHSGYIDYNELTAVHGGDATGLFRDLDSNRDGVLSLSEWQDFFLRLKKKQGPQVLGYILRQMENTATAQGMLREVVSSM